MTAARVDVDAVARHAGVDPKTVQRWLGGRVPHPSSRWAVAALLNADQDHLWPKVRGGLACGAPATGEVVAAYGRRADLPPSAWSAQFSAARERIDLLGYAMLHVLEQHPDLPAVLRERAAAGCKVRIALGDPASPAVRARDEEEGLSGGLMSRIETSLLYFRDLFGCEGVSIHLHGTPLYNSVFRFDREMFVTPHLLQTPGYRAPVLHLRRLGPDGVFEAFAQHFERVWATSRPAESP